MGWKRTAAAVLVAVASSAATAALTAPRDHAAVSPAAITLHPDCGPAGAAPQRYSITIDGTNFNPILNIVVTFDAGPGGHPESFKASTDGFGHFNTSITPNERAADTYQVRADDLREREATAAFTVPCNTPPPPPRCTASITLSPSLAAPGYITQLTGTGFTGISKVTVAWDHGIGTIAPIPVTNGGFTSAVLILPHDLPGPRTLTVDSSSSPSANLSCASAKFLVLPGSMQPQDFVVRR